MLPTEDREQATFVQYLRARGIDHFRVPNETYTKSFKQKMKNKALGVSSGVPDIFVIAGGRLRGIEMKRKKGGVVSVTQKEWISKLNAAEVPTVVCRGAEEAIKFVESCER